MSVMLVGLSAAVNQQRYRDAVNSYVDFWQQQYNQVANVRNDRTDATTCSSGGLALNLTPDVGRGAGTSDCTIIGRLIATTDGVTVKSSPVYATIAPQVVANQSDVSLLLGIGLISDDAKADTYEMSWGSRVVDTDSTPRQFSILIVRMPTHGLVHTYVDTSGTKSAADIVRDVNPAAQTDYVMCVDPTGLITTPSLGMILQRDASNSSGITSTAEGAC